ncbi:Alpha-L-fucosidase [compost metagenome]
MPLCTNWGYVPNDEIKSMERVIRTLVEVVAKGGNLLLGVGPKADGTIPENVEQRLLEIGAWMDANKEAIYETRSLDYYQEESIFFTENLKKKKIYALVVSNESFLKTKTVSWSVHLPKKGTTMIYLPTGEKVKWKISDEQVVVQLPESIIRSKSGNPVWSFAFETE